MVRFGLQGHTHTEYFEVVQSYSNPGKALMLNTIGGSVTTYTKMNPSFMLIEFDQQTLLPINMKTYFMDVNKANESGEPTWELLHDYLDTYHLKDLSPSSMLELSESFLVDDELASLFEWNKYRQARPRPTSVNKGNLHCNTASSEMHELFECLERFDAGSAPI